MLFSVYACGHDESQQTRSSGSSPINELSINHLDTKNACGPQTSLHAQGPRGEPDALPKRSEPHSSPAVRVADEFNGGTQVPPCSPSLGIQSGNLFGIRSHICSDIVSYVRFGLCRTFFLAFCLACFLTSFLTFYLAHILT